METVKYNEMEHNTCARQQKLWELKQPHDYKVLQLI